jgi:hypothetical protein
MKHVRTGQGIYLRELNYRNLIFFDMNLKIGHVIVAQYRRYNIRI